MSVLLAALLVMGGCSKGADENEPGRQGSIPAVSGDREIAMTLYIDDREVPVIWENNDSVAELEDLASGELIIPMSMYGGFEQVGDIGHSITSDDSDITTAAGDIVLYSDDQIVIFYGSNSWSYTRLGKVDLEADELTDLLANGDVTLRLTAE